MEQMTIPDVCVKMKEKSYWLTEHLDGIEYFNESTIIADIAYDERVMDDYGHSKSNGIYYHAEIYFDVDTWSISDFSFYTIEDGLKTNMASAQFVYDVMTEVNHYND